MKKALSILLAVLLLCSTGTLAIPASAATVVASGRSVYVDWKLESDGKLTLSGSGYTAEFTQTNRPPWEPYKSQIKTLVIGNGVSKISNYSFYNYTALSGTITFPASMRTIGSSAFEGCTGLTGAPKLNSGLVSMGTGSFRRCTSMRGSLVIPDTVTDLGTSTFSNCISLDGGLTLSRNLTKIPYAAFADCIKMSGSLVIPDNVTEILPFAFSNCGGLNGQLKIGNSVERIYWQAFENCSGLTGDLVIPDSVKEIDPAAFLNCVGFNGKLQLGNGLEQLPEMDSATHGAFYGCKNLSGELVLPESLTVIGQNSFSECNNLTGDFVLPSHLTTIGNRAFSECYNLSGTLVIPESVTTIGIDPFHACARDTDIVQFFANDPGYISVTETVTARPSCTTTGTKTVSVKCTKCNSYVLSKTETLPVQHSIMLFARKEPSGGRDGTLAYYYCPLCDKYFEDEAGTVELPDDYDFSIHCPGDPKQENAKVETAEQPASFDLVTRCRTHTTVVLDRETFTLTMHPAKEATYREDGNIKYYTDESGTKYVYDELRRVFNENDDVFIHLTLIPATSIEMNQTNVDLRVDDTFQLVATVKPENASLKDVTFTSSDEAILSVNEDGLITALKPGTATVTCSTEEGLTASVIVTVQHKHIAGEPQMEDITKEATCCESGVGDLVSRCTECGEELERETGVTIPPTGIHPTELVPACEATAEADGNIAYYICTTCDGLFKDDAATEPTTAAEVTLHFADTPKQENIRLESGNQPASFDLVTYCKHDGTELTRETVLLEVHPAKEATLEEDGNVKYYTDEDGNKYVYDEETGTFTETEDVSTQYPIVMEEHLDLDCSEIQFFVGMQDKIGAEIRPQDATFQDVTFRAEDPTILQVDDDGTITALAEGETNVIVSTHHGIEERVHVVVLHSHVAGEAQYEEITEEPTCITPGCGKLVTRCTDCGAFMSSIGPVEIPATGIHQTELVPAREPSEDADGCKEHYVCTSCNGLFWDEEAKQPTTEDEIRLHFADAPQIENSRSESENQPASFELVTYCKHDHTELDRKTVTLEKHPAIEASLLGDGNVEYYTDDDGYKYVYDEETEVFKPVVDVTVPFVPIPVEKLHVNEDDLHLVIGETFQLETTTEPENATFPQVIFTSSDESVAEVNPLGLVTAKSEGTATIECVTGDGATATVTVTVQHKHVAGEPQMEGITKAATCCETGVGDLVTRCTVCGEEIDREEDVSIPATGVHLTELVPAHEPTEEADGCKEHYICTTCDSLFKDEEAEQPTTLEEITLHFADTPRQENIRLESDDQPASFDLVTYCKHDSTELDRKTVTLEMHPAKEATLEEDGNVKYYTDEDGNKYVYDEETGTFTETEDVSTRYPIVIEEDLLLNGYGFTIPMYAQVQIIATVLPENATFKDVTYTVKNPTILRVDEDGTMTPLSIGETYVIVTTHHGLSENIPITVVHGHVAGEPHFEDITIEPTCVEPGLGAWVVRCEECGAFMSSISPVEIPATGIHLTKLVSAREPSEDADGCKEHYVCTSCNGLFWDEEAKQPTTAEELVLHFADTPRIENSKSESENRSASFDLVTYCMHDVTELDRKTVILEMHPAKDATPTEDGNVKYYTDEDGNKYVYDEDSTAFVPMDDVSTQFPIIPVTGIELNTDIIDLHEGETFQLIATAQPEDATFSAVSFTSSDESVLSVSEDGLITALKPGTATVVCRTQDGVSVTVTVTVEHNHIAGEPSMENITKEPTCSEPGVGDLVTRCTVCNEELHREKGVTIPATGKHTPDEGQKTQEIKGTCSTEGSYVFVVKCRDCGEVLSSETISTGYGDHAWNNGDLKSGKYDKYTVTDYTCQHCGQHRTEKTRNPNYQFRCKRCDWYDARRDTKGVLGLIYKLIHDITHMVQHINFLT